MRGIRHKWLLATLAVVLVAGMSSPAGALEEFYVPNSITGWVVDESGKPFDHVQFGLYRADGQWIMPAHLEADGSYLFPIQTLAAGEYYLRAEFPGMPYYDEYVPGTDEFGNPYTFTINPGDAFTNVNVRATRYRGISGVFYEASGTCNLGWWASLIEINTGTPVVSTRAQWGPQLNDRYHLPTEGLPRGEYTVRFDCGQRTSTIARSYLGNSSTLASAKRILVGSGDEVAGLNAAQHAVELGNARVNIQVAGKAYAGDARVTFTGTDGEHYEFESTSASLPLGAYAVEVVTDLYAPAFATVNVAPWPAIASATVALDEGEVVSGVVLHDGQPVVGAVIDLVRVSDGAVLEPSLGFQRSWDPVPLTNKTIWATPPPASEAGAETSADGSFQIERVPPGTYTVFVRGQHVGLPSFYLGGGHDRQQAMSFTVSSSPVDVAAVVVPAFGSISGDITWSDDSRAQNFFLPLAFTFDTVSSEWVVATYAVYPYWQVQSDHTYEMLLPPGQYRVGLANIADGIHFAPGLAAEFYPNAVDVADAQTITVAASSSRTDVDFALSALLPVMSARLAGNDRYATAADVAGEYAPHVDVVYVASGQDFPDALAAAPAATMLGGPLLLVEPNGVPHAIRTEILRLQPKEIVVVGGPGAVGPVVYAELATLAGAQGIRRVAGLDRFATAQAIVRDSWSSADAVYLASGFNFPDALSAAAIAGAAHIPVLTIDGSRSTLDPTVTALLRDLGVTKVYLAGGTGVISIGIEDQLIDLYGSDSVQRNAGPGRYETAAAINYHGAPLANEAFIATGATFPDALAGAALAATRGAPLYLVPGSCMPPYVMEDLNRLRVKHVTTLGGTGVVSLSLGAVALC